MVGDFMPKIQASKNCLFVNLPMQYCKAFGWTKGQELLVYPSGQHELVIKEMPK